MTLAQQRALRMNVLLGALENAARDICEAYDDTAYNDEQPADETLAVYPCSIDEWVGNITELRRAWAIKADGL